MLNREEEKNGFLCRVKCVIRDNWCKKRIIESQSENKSRFFQCLTNYIIYISTFENISSLDNTFINVQQTNGK